MAKAVPLSEFRVNSARILEGLSETRGFAYLTKNGYSVAVVADVEEFERMYGYAIDTVSGGYVGSWYHVEYDKAYVLTLNGDGTARYYDKTLVQPLMFGKWEVGENMKVSFFEPEGEQPNASAGEEFAFYTTPNEDGSIPSSPATLSYKGSYSSSQIWLFWPSKAAAEAEWAERNPNKAAVS